jgi:radical SAM/Cys-rich protein
VLNLVYNPQGPALPPSQDRLEADYKRELFTRHGIVFNQLFTLTNMPIKRFGTTLVNNGQFEPYLALLRAGHDDTNLDGTMCRTTLSVDYRGHVYDCDFNQMLDLPLRDGTRPLHLGDLLNETLDGRAIRVAGHCYACTAGQGSSCGGALSQAAE